MQHYIYKIYNTFTTIHTTIHVLKITFLRLGLKSFIPCTNLPGRFLDHVASSMNYCISFHTLVWEVLQIL